MRKRVLVVDHSPLARALTRGVLAGAGYEVSEAAHGEEALTILAAERIDVVISEIEMPGLDGIALLYAMRSDREFGRIPFLVLTTETRRERIAEARREGARIWIAKPFRPEVLLDAVAMTTRDA